MRSAGGQDGGPAPRLPCLRRQEKQLKYASLVASLSPSTREHIRWFGQYVLDMNDLPEPLEPRPLPFEPAL